MLYGMIFVHSFLAAARIKWARYNIRLWRYYVIALPMAASLWQFRYGPSGGCAPFETEISSLPLGSNGRGIIYASGDIIP